jgi:hypothetical protein
MQWSPLEWYTYWCLSEAYRAQLAGSIELRLLVFGDGLDGFLQQLRLVARVTAVNGRQNVHGRQLQRCIVCKKFATQHESESSTYHKPAKRQRIQRIIQTPKQGEKKIKWHKTPLATIMMREN